MSKTVAFINSKLYPVLLEKGGDRLIAFYAHLKAAKAGQNRLYPITAKNGRKIKHLNLVKKVTGFTKNTCVKYMKMLIQLEVCNYSKDGGVYMIGNNKAVEKYVNNAMVPINLGKKLSETAAKSFGVRVYYEERKQKERIQEKQHQINLMHRADKGSYLSVDDYKIYKALIKSEKKLKGIEKFCDKVVLSREGFAKLKDGSEDNKSKGRYWKAVLKSAGVITYRRNNKFIMKCSEEAYSKIKYFEHNPRLNWYAGRMYEETISEFTTAKFFDTPTTRVPETKKRVSKPREYLSFDFIAWCEND